MSKYLYNGIELPALPAWDKEKYPYAYIELTHVNDSGIIPYTDRFELRVFSSYDYKTTTNGTDTIYCEAENSLQWKIPVDENDEPTTSEWGSYEATSEYVSLNWLVWSNFDIFARDGMTVWFSASDPVPVLPDPLPVSPYLPINGAWVKHDIYKQVGNSWVKQPQKGYETQQGMWQAIFEQQLPEPEPEPEAPKEPIAYMYGTKQLPPLPEWDKEAYPYAYIAYYSNYYYAYFSSVQLYFRTVNTLFYYLTSKSDEDGQYQRISCHKNDLSAWSDLPEKEGVFGAVQIGTLYWCNVDCYKEGGTTLHLAASEPVPVYE